ncbi:hypothetical protein [Engelhardtia mirabilis]|uniref:Uncharacterized protein n=1 Tax=Engelhardtia mirabilis TaxID=2528011 RepID=A0A518BMK3_9BACT|nr:hypothetical protein Pla133_32710 [Planctomycetes bacterium Pla133]QDV02503.1 hypothetical protein Pla86_32700 [Planctomycetes bacterium Pla86]
MSLRLLASLAIAAPASAQGLHGYIGYEASPPPDRSEYAAGMGFYSAVWPLIDEPLDGFQIGLAGAWILPDNSDNRDVPLAPEGTLARRWAERGPTWDSVFQTVEGGLGYWRGNRFRYGPPKFSMNATPQCYDYEVGSPGWSFFYDTEALPDDRLGIAQLSNRILIPPDALPFEGNPRGKFMGYTYMALPFTDPVPADADTGREPTGDQAWTCFVATQNFKGPIAYYIPETWSKIARLFDEPFLHGRGLDARAGVMGGGAMEINTVPRLEATATDGTRYARIPRLSFPVDADGRAVLVQDVSYYSKAALYDDFLAWRRGGEPCSGSFRAEGTFVAKLSTRSTRYDQSGKPIEGVNEVFDTRVFDDNTWGLVWNESEVAEPGQFPEYFRVEEERCVAVAAKDVPRSTGLRRETFALATPGAPFTSPDQPTAGSAWSEPGPASPARKVKLGDGSLVTYRWYRFVDQPSLQQYRRPPYSWSDAKCDALQAFIEELHRQWPTDRDYMAPPTSGELVRFDPALFVSPPKGMEVGYVPIVARQERAR